MVKNMKGEITVFILVAVAVAVVIGILTPIVTKKPDTPIEQASEAFIMQETGKQVDFSASLKEHKPDTVSNN